MNVFFVSKTYLFHSSTSFKVLWFFRLLENKSFQWFQSINLFLFQNILLPYSCSFFVQSSSTCKNYFEKNFSNLSWKYFFIENEIKSSYLMLNISCNAFVIVFFEYKQFFQSPKRLKKKKWSVVVKKDNSSWEWPVMFHSSSYLAHCCLQQFLCILSSFLLPSLVFSFPRFFISSFPRVTIFI